MSFKASVSSLSHSYVFPRTEIPSYIPPCGLRLHSWLISSHCYYQVFNNLCTKVLQIKLALLHFLLVLPGIRTRDSRKWVENPNWPTSLTYCNKNSPAWLNQELCFFRCNKFCSSETILLTDIHEGRNRGSGQLQQEAAVIAVICILRIHTEYPTYCIYFSPELYTRLKYICWLVNKLLWRCW